MRNIFSFDMRKHRPSKKETIYEAIDGQKYRVTGAFGRLEKLNQRYAEAMPEKNRADRICSVSYNIGEICMRLLLSYPLVMIVLAIVFFERLNSHPFQTLFYLLIPAMVLGVIFVICLMLGKIFVPKTSRRISGFDVSKLVQDFDKELRKTLAIPENAERIDILYFAYQFRGKKAIQSKSRLGLHFTNIENLAYVKEGKLCLTDGHELFEIPKSSIMDIHHMDQRGNADLSSWNKKEDIDNEHYARYRVRQSGDHYYMPLPAVYQVEVKNRPEDFYFLVPGYDIEALCRVLGRPVPKLPVLPEVKAKKKGRR